LQKNLVSVGLLNLERHLAIGLLPKRPVADRLFHRGVSVLGETQRESRPAAGFSGVLKGVKSYHAEGGILTA
jgi:hypothetical protein